DYLLCFFAVLVRVSTFIVVVPFFGDRVIPAPVKILLSLALSMTLFPVLLARGLIDPHGSVVWSRTASALIGTVSLEVLLGLALGFVVKIMFDAVQMGSDIMGSLMGLGAANQFDPFQEVQTQILSHFQMAIAMLLFLALDGHHIVLQAFCESFRVIQ